MLKVEVPVVGIFNKENTVLLRCQNCGTITGTKCHLEDTAGVTADMEPGNSFMRLCACAWEKAAACCSNAPWGSDGDIGGTGTDSATAATSY